VKAPFTQARIWPVTSYELVTIANFVIDTNVGPQMQCGTRNGAGSPEIWICWVAVPRGITPIAEERALAAKDFRISSVVRLGPSSAMTQRGRNPRLLDVDCEANLAQKPRRETQRVKNRIFRIGLRSVTFLFCCLSSAAADPSSMGQTNIFAPESTPAKSILHLSILVLTTTGIIFVAVSTLLVYSILKFRARSASANSEPAQVYGSTQIELAWTIIPILIVIVLFVATARGIHEIQDAPMPATAVEVIVIGHQFWWEYRYPQLGVVTANELHIPVSDPLHPRPTFLQLLSADTDHSFWVPELAGKTDLIPNHPNRMWMDPQHMGTFVGQCAQYCGTQHAKMLLRVSVDSPEDFAEWVREQRRSAIADERVAAGKRVFETTACINCHSINGAVADGRFGPDLTHLMGRSTIAAGAALNTPENLRLWIENPEAIKRGSLMPAMQLSKSDLDALVGYLETLR
jgi:cytochrome c oxidase subunit II